jgi:hypothetical protein
MKPSWAEYYDGPGTLIFPREVRVEGPQNSGETLTVVLYIFIVICTNFFNNYLVFSIFFLRVCSPPRLRVEPLWVKLLFLRKGVLPYIY